MPVKKAGKQTAGGRKRKATVAGARKTAGKAAKRISALATKARKGASKAVAGTAKHAKALASNPKRAVRKAADNVHQTATRARQIGDSVATAGTLITEAADFVDTLALRAKKGAARGRTVKKRSR